MHSLSCYSWKAGKSFHLSATGNCGMKFIVQSISGGLCWKDQGPTLTSEFVWDEILLGVFTDGLGLATKVSNYWPGHIQDFEAASALTSGRWWAQGWCLCSSFISERSKILITKLWGWQTRAEFFFLVNNTQCSDSCLPASAFCCLSVSLPNSICS